MLLFAVDCLLMLLLFGVDVVVVCCGCLLLFVVCRVLLFAAVAV